MRMRVLGIETSADDTGIALIEAEGKFGPDFKFKILANGVSSQKIHAEYGGIYPNLAKREHGRNLPLVLEKVLKESSGTTKDMPPADVIAVTYGPGLEPCLWTGITFAQELSKKWNVPIVPVNHMEGHILISMMENGRIADFEFPAIALLISGGHTELIHMKEFGTYKYIGRTRDDAVGEAFDKVARLLGFPYPGGPYISQLANDTQQCDEATPHRIHLPRPMIHENNFDFSFAGLKTAVLRLVEKHQPLSEEMKKTIAREFEDAVTDVLVYKTLRAVEECGASTVIMGGGVSANKHIRNELNQKLRAVGCQLLVCPPELSTDNGLMIALAGYFHALKKEFTDLASLKADGNLSLASLSK